MSNETKELKREFKNAKSKGVNALKMHLTHFNSTHKREAGAGEGGLIKRQKPARPDTWCIKVGNDQPSFANSLKNCFNERATIH